jgi:hypothetical protein
LVLPDQAIEYNHTRPFPSRRFSRQIEGDPSVGCIPKSRGYRHVAADDLIVRGSLNLRINGKTYYVLHYHDRRVYLMESSPAVKQDLLSRLGAHLMEPEEINLQPV